MRKRRRPHIRCKPLRLNPRAATTTTTAAAGEVNVVCNWRLELAVPVRVTTPRPLALGGFVVCTVQYCEQAVCCLEDNA